ncbi:MAG: YhfC family glutamic-type intramembrane protease [Anaerolineae bacterium]
MKKRFSFILLAALVLILAGCSSFDETSRPMEGASVTGATLDEGDAGTYMPFTVRVEQTGDPIGVDFRGILATGSLRVQLLDSEGQAIWEEAVVSPGTFAVNTVVRPPESGEYQLGLAWDGPVQASYSLQWKPGEIEIATISPVASLGGLGMIAVAVGFVIYAALRRLGWGYLGLGALAWVVTVMLKFAWAVPVNSFVYNGLYDALPEVIAALLFYLYVGALTGIFEVGVVWLVMRYTRLGRVSWKRALAFGIGFGAVEALLLGLSSLGTVLTAVAVPGVFPLEALEQVSRLNNVLYGLAPISERFFTVLVHILANVLIFYAIAQRRPKWFWLAFAYMTGLDAVAAFAQFWGLETLAKIWTIEAVVALWGIVGWLGIRWVQQRYPNQAEAQVVNRRETRL